jgi:hypothetical protein
MIFCCFCRIDWTPLEQKLFIEFVIIRSKGDKGILKQDAIWKEILEDITPLITSEKCNVAVLKNKLKELKSSCKAITQMVEYDGYKINKIVDGIDTVEGVILNSLNSYYHHLLLSFIIYYYHHLLCTDFG